jgi:PAS domain S-box-containing protein
LEEAFAGGEAALSDFYRCPNGHVRLDTVAPILDSQGRPLAAVVLRINAEDLLYPLIQSWPTPSRSAETLLVCVEGEDVLYLNELRHQPGTALSLRLPLTRTDLPAVQAALGKQGRFEGKDYRGVRVLADLRPIPQSPWFVVAKVDAAEILAEAHYRAGVIVFFVVLFILLAAALTAYGYRQRQAGLYRELYQAERQQQEAQEEFRTTLYSIGDAVITTDAAGQVRQMNPEAERLTGWPEAEARGRPLDEVFHILNEESRATVENPVRRVLREGIVVGLANHSLLIARDGVERPIADSGAPIRDEGGAITGVVLVFRDQSEERAAQKALRESEERFSTVFSASPIGISITRIANGQFIDVNDAFLSMFGYTREEVIGHTSLELRVYADPEDRDRFVGLLRKEGRVHDVETKFRRKSGEIGDLLVSAELIELAGEQYMLALMHDITERKQAEEEHQKLEAQLRQAQKMEAVGRLAGGVAHDFNNMLGVILGYADMALSRLNPADPLYQDLQEIAGAARRSADLTRQLLAFSRRQTIAPQVLDLNVQMKGMERLLRRIIGEDIALEFALALDLWPVRLDPSQVDQVVANLAVNSRDAMPDGGKLTVETGNMTFDEAYRQTHPWVLPGDYALLTVSDNGCGMDKEALEHVFEPFFTAKAEGKGTGLGLATVYGIVKQNNGFTDIYSEPGQGTTVKIYFPRHRGEAQARPVAAPELAPVGGQETILLVEDEDQLRRLARTLLERLGYRVLEAASPGEALILCEKHEGEIRLLLTDVVMPNMSGKELAERISAIKPGLKTLFMSGYTADAIAQRGVLEEGIHFLQKPFPLDALAKKVREALRS